MDQNEFIEGIKIAVVESAKKSVKSNLIEPPGRQPHTDLVKMSNWFNNLNDHDKAMVLSVVKESVDTTVFGFLCVLDGVRAIENVRGNKGDLKLYFEKDGNQVLLNDLNEDFLHDLI